MDSNLLWLSLAIVVAVILILDKICDTIKAIVTDKHLDELDSEFESIDDTIEEFGKHKGLAFQGCIHSDADLERFIEQIREEWEEAKEIINEEDN